MIASSENIKNIEFDFKTEIQRFHSAEDGSFLILRPYLDQQAQFISWWQDKAPKRSNSSTSHKTNLNISRPVLVKISSDKKKQDNASLSRKEVTVRRTNTTTSKIWIRKPDKPIDQSNCRHHVSSSAPTMYTVKTRIHQQKRSWRQKRGKNWN